MDNQESTGRATGEGPGTTRREHRRRSWPIAVVILALAGALFSLATLRGGDATTAAAPASDVDMEQLAAESPLAVPLYEELSGSQQHHAADRAAAQPAAAQPSAAAEKTVEIMNYQYAPATIEVAVGDTVTWTNHDSAPHNVVVTDGPEKFTSPLIEQGQSWSYTFTQAGEYSYYCSVHPDMKASVTVGGSAEPTDPEAPPTTEPTEPSAPPSDGCIPSDLLQPILDHVRAAHLETSPGQQVQDLLNLDSYLQSHMVWLEQVLTPVLDGTANQVVQDTLQPILDHVRAAHLETSPGQQVQDLLNLDSYLQSHTVWLEQVLTPLMNQATC